MGFRVALGAAWLVASVIALGLLGVYFPLPGGGGLLSAFQEPTYREVCRDGCVFLEPFYERIGRGEFSCEAHCDCIDTEVASRYPGGADALIRAQMELEVPPELDVAAAPRTAAEALGEVGELVSKGQDSMLARQMNESMGQAMGTRPRSPEADRYFREMDRLTRIMTRAQEACIRRVGLL